MTKVRPPVSFDQAVTRIVGLIGYDVAMRICGRSEPLIRKWTDDAQPFYPTVELAVKLDAAYIAAGGSGAPLLDTYALLLDRETAIACADAEALSSATANAAKEAGEAISALVLASRPGASSRDRARAEAETEEAIGAFASTMRQLGGKPSAAGVPGGSR